jgi:hypothetical protein
MVWINRTVGGKNWVSFTIHGVEVFILSFFPARIAPEHRERAEATMFFVNLTIEIWPRHAARTALR